MISYAFSNKKERMDDIVKFMSNSFSMETIDSDNDSISLGNNDLYAIIDKETTMVMLLNDNINISLLRKYFMEKING